MRARTLLSAWMFVTAACTGGRVGGTCDARVEPGDDDHAAISAALAALSDGQTLCLTGGRFVLDAPLAIAGRSEITIAGAGFEEPEGTVLDFAPQTSGDALTISQVSELTLRDLTVEAAAGRGVVLEDADGATLERLSVFWDPELRRGGDGLAIVGSRGVRVSASSFLASRGAGVIVTRSEDCLLDENGAFDSLAGFVLDDSRRCELRLNSAEVNGVGVLVADSPSDPATSSENTLRENIVLENNAILERPAGSLLEHVPTGVGVVILAADDTEVVGNQIEGNAAAGVMVLAYTTLVELAGAPAAGSGYDPYPSLVHLHDDVYVENGFDPSTGADPLVTELLARVARTELADVVWDGALASGGEPGTLCLRPDADSASTFLDLDARGGFAAPSEDASPHDCSHPGHGLIDP